jgi:uncharacterized protein
MDKPASPPANFSVFAALFEGGLAIGALGFGWLLGCPPLVTFHWEPAVLLFVPLAAAPMVLVLAVLLWRPIGLFAEVPRIVDGRLLPLFRSWGLVEMAAISILAGLGEEMLFRGVFQATLGELLAKAAGPEQAVWMGGRASDWAAMVAVALVFGAAHWVNTGYAILATAIGLYLGWLWIFTGNLMYPIATHALYDFLALVYLVKLRRTPSAAA